MKITHSSMIFWLNFWSIDKYRSFANVFVDCVVLGWLKPNKLCRLVKIMSQFAIKVILVTANVVFVSWWVSICIRFKNFCTKDRKTLNEFEILSWIEHIKQTFWIWNNDSPSYTRFMIGLSWKLCCSWKLHNQIWFFVSNFEVMTNTGQFLTLFVDCVVLGWLKPTKLWEWSK